MVPRAGIEPARLLSLAADFKSAVSTSFTTAAESQLQRKARVRTEIVFVAEVALT